MRWLKKEYRGKVIRVICVGYKSGRKVYAIDYADGHEEEMFEEEMNALFEK